MIFGLIMVEGVVRGQYAAKYLSDRVYRRKIARQLNRGKSIHALRRQLHYAREGKVARRQPEQQNAQRVVSDGGDQRGHMLAHRVSGSGRRRTARRRPRGGRRGPGAHLPARSSAVNYYGSITVDYERELAQIENKGHRPLRTVATDEPGAGL